MPFEKGRDNLFALVNLIVQVKGGGTCPVCVIGTVHDYLGPFRDSDLPTFVRVRSNHAFEQLYIQVRSVWCFICGLDCIMRAEADSETKD